MRTQPYTEVGIKRIPCARCSKPSTQQWQVCAMDNRYMGVCQECDILLNALVIKFMGLKAEYIKKYKAKYNKNGNPKNS